MIGFRNNVFKLDTANTSYLFRITKFNHLEHVYYGRLITRSDSARVLAQKRTVPMGCGITYDKSDEIYSLDSLCLEWSDNGRGDYRQSPAELKMPDGSFVSDFIYQTHHVIKGGIEMKSLPSAYGAEGTLIIDMLDKSNQTKLTLHYSLFPECDVITRRAVLTHTCEGSLTIRRFMSMMVDLPDENFDMYTLDGGWIREAHLHKRNVSCGIIVNSSTTGASSNRHNPGFFLAEGNATEDSGHVYGFNLVYSGNHYGMAEKSGLDHVRIALGINPHMFEWILEKDASFESPEAVMTFTGKGFNGMSRNMHDFVNEHIVRGDWKKKERPVLLNNWEAHFFDFNESRLLKLAGEAKSLGVELFVVDDGWFGKRNSDRAGLGDYSVNPKKFPGGLKAFSDKIHGLGLDFGLWFEPEMVNEDSDLYRAHPEYAVALPGKEKVLGRNQLVLDLCRPEVRDYIVENVGRILDENNINYVKWDMNRHIAEAYSGALKNQGEFHHRYIIGLYEILSRIFSGRSHILLESCSSGGNRFDLGMLCHSPQIWASDDTDPVERLKIQGGLSCLYPASTMGSHVSQSPHQQTLRDTPLSTRFNVSAFGCLGYELDLKFLSPEEKKEIGDQIAFYRKYRRVFQFGKFSRGLTYKDNKVVWQAVSDDNGCAVSGFFQTMAGAAESQDKLVVKGLSRGTYSVQTRKQRLYIKRFGGLMKHVLPVELDPDGPVLRTAGRHFSLRDCVEQYQCSNLVLETGIPLNSQFMGTGYNPGVRMLGDFGSSLYVIERKKGVDDE
ncbi:MAG: alpha-galactosidase [Spirochaetales bacterium]|nr:alpha-galactosidase [Spirochaetales bacterium]